MITCIAEKPSVAKEIADILGAKSRKDGYFEGNGYRVTWTFGHLCTLKEPNDYFDDWKRWKMKDLPMIPFRFGIKIIDDGGIKKQFDIVSKIFRQSDEIINCGDAGQEGELIQRWVIQKSKAKCKVKRLWISSLTEEAIREGFKNLQEEKVFQNLYEAGLCRAMGDWLLGMNCTRLYTIKYGANKNVLSIGRVQTPTLALIVNRNDEIVNFVPKQFFELKTTYRDTSFSCTKGRFESKEEGEKILDAIKSSEFEIISTSIKEGKEFPPKLFDLTSLQVECNKKFAFSADETLKLIQSLYEKKLTTYPRVDTTFLSDDIFPKVPGILKNLKGFESLVSPLLEKKIKKDKRVFNSTKVTDHHAIIPTGVSPNGITSDEKKVYELIVKKFIAAFYPFCKVSNSTIQGKADKYKFKTTGRQVLDPGWRAVYMADDTNGKDSDSDSNQEDSNNKSSAGVLPNFEKGEKGPHKPELSEKWTNPPKQYTEATLLRAMETAGKLVDDEQLSDALKENGIGRPSTRAAIIETLFKRNYITKKRKNLIPTQTGINLINLITDERLKSAALTGVWEKKLRDIEKGEYKAALFIEEIKEMVKEVVYSVRGIKYKKEGKKDY